jgi:parvulin-like peptidyl-prolyl isomerase
MRIAFAFLLTATVAPFSHAQENPPPAQPAVVATIDGEPVLAAEVERELASAYRGRKLTDDEKRELLPRVRDQVIDRKLVLRRLVRTGQAASQADVDLALSRLEKQLAERNLTLGDHCREIGLTVEDIGQTLLWQLTWQAYLDKQLTPQNLQRYFQEHRRDFDGTQLKVAHILIKPAGEGAAAKATAIAQAEIIRAEIAATKDKFADAARKHSAGPSAADGGDIGWIERRTPMPEEFSAAAFALQAGEVSQPVTTKFGVHLIQVLEIKPGEKTAEDVATILRPAVTRYVFAWLADKDRETAKIERTGP